MMNGNKKEKIIPKSGEFILRGGCCQKISRSGLEVGVVLNKDYYVDIDALVNVPISREEARCYSMRLNRQLPSKKQMQLLIDNLGVVNNSLLSIGRVDCLLLGDVSDDFWVKGMRCDKKTRKKVIFIMPVGQK